MAWCGVCCGRFLILHVDYRGIYVVEDMASGVVTVLVTRNGVGFGNGRATKTMISFRFLA